MTPRDLLRIARQTTPGDVVGAAFILALFLGLWAFAIAEAVI